ncbi:MAG: PQQ-like beta-propeller repeat protein [Gemmataceae bacterium]|nr:PQQ-like beta-propeller repeat protein [Gemmataceae bacterium]MDW8265034.1 PQQ-binding-like beta-propeller repeat protein [Gemmataceae bacterium]
MRAALVLLGQVLCGIALVACSPRAEPNPPPRDPSAASDSGPQLSHPNGPAPQPLGDSNAASDNVPDLRTRKTGSDWPGFLGPFGNGVSPEKGILAPWPERGLRIVWQLKLGSGYAMPSISRGRLFHFDRHLDQARLRCLHSETGQHLWTFQYPTNYEDYYGYDDGPRCCPVVDGDRVYLHGVEGMLHCLRVTDGQLVWKVDTKKDFGVVQNFFGVGSTPVVEGDLLIVQVGGSPPTDATAPREDLKGNGSGVVAFDKYTGKVRYRVTDELASYASPVLATINGRRWCFVFARGGLVGLEPSSGKVDFHFPWRARDLYSVNAANPVVVGDLVFISECYGPGSAVLRVRPGGYERLWDDAGDFRRKAMQCHWSTPIAHQGFLYGCSGRHTGHAELRCIELATGRVRWREPGLTRTSLLLVDGHFVCLSEDGILRLIKVNPDHYEEVSRWEVGGPEPLLEYPCWAAPILAHGLLYVRGKDRLVCLELIPPKP